jgi:heat shock protein HtpX
MFQTLPQQTVFEARAKARRDTALLLFLLLVVYAVCFALMGLSLFLLLGGGFRMNPLGWYVSAASMAVGIAVAATKYAIAQMASLDDLLETLRARPADLNDEYHQRIIRLVREVETATNLRGIRVAVISSTALNAFSMADREGNMVLGVTEGLIGRLDRSELEAVVAHEAAHLAQGDSRLLTLAGSLCGSFEAVTDSISPFQNRASEISSPGSYGRGRGGGGFLFVWLVASLGKCMTRLLSMALSRSREYLADAQAVRMTQNPLALTEALRKIAGKYRGGNDAPSGFQSVFIMNPEAADLDESEGVWADLFSTHPPAGKRIQRLLEWANADVTVFKKSLEKEPEPLVVPEGGPPEARYFAFLGEAWVGPYRFTQLLSSGQVKPDTWVCPEGSEAVSKAGEAPDLSQLFSAQVQEAVAAEKCPHCHVSLVHRTYEGAPVLFCPFCSGYLTDSSVLERIVARRDQAFDESKIQKALEWRKAQKETSLNGVSGGVTIPCPVCGRLMSKAFHLLLTRVVIDRCPYDGKIWLDGGELETIQILVEQSMNLYALK